VNVLQHIDRLGDAFREFARVLTKDGIIVANTLNLWSPYLPLALKQRSSARRGALTATWITPVALRSVLSMSGFEIVSSAGFAALPGDSGKMDTAVMLAGRYVWRGPLVELAPVRYFVARRSAI
jgi:hypothetical protein